MESENRQSPEDSPHDAHAIKEVISKVKSQGLFDQFRKECLADVDTKPAYNNLIQRVEKFVERFLNGQKWNTNVNKNQLRDALRRQLNNSGVMNIGVDRIIEQVVNPKILLGIKPKIDEAVCSYLGVDLKTRQEEQQKRKQEQQRLMLQQQQLQQQHLQSLMNQNVKPDENFGRIHPNPWSHTANGANFPGSSMAGGVNSAGGSFNPQGFGGIMQPFYTGGWASGMQGMEGFNQTMQPGQPMIPGQPMVPQFSNGGIASTVNNVSPFNSSASPSVSNVNTSFSAPALPAQSTAVQNIPDFSKPPPGIPGAPLLNSASSLGSSPVPGMPLQSNTVVPPGILPGSVGNIIRPPPPGSVPPPPGTVPVIAPSAPLRSIPTTPTIPALISHTLSKVSKEELTPEKIAVFKTAAAFITKTVSNAQGTPGADLATMFSPRVLAEAMMAESGKPLTKHEIRAARRKERMKEFERLKAEREREEEEEQRRITALNHECRHNLMDVFKAAEDVSEDEEAFDMLIDAEELGNKHKQGVILSDDSKDEEEKEKPPTSQPGKKYNFAWDVDRDVGALSDVTVSSIHTSDISSFEELSSDSEDAVEPTADDEQEKEESDLNTGEQSASSETVAEETTVISEERKLSEHANFPEKPDAVDSSPVHETEVVKVVNTPDHEFAEVVPSVSAAVLADKQKPNKSVPNKPRKLVALSYRYSDSDDDETREERKARIAKEKEERYMKRQQRRTEMEAKRKERDEERARLREEKKKQKAQQEEIGAEEKVALESAAENSASEDHNASVNSTEPETSSRSTPRKRKNKAEMKEQLLQQKVFEKKAALRRQRTRNNRYVPDACNPIYEKKASNQSYTDAAVDPEEVVTFDGNLEIVEVTVDQECVVETVGEDMDTMKDELILQCRSPYSDISDRSMSDKSEDEQKVAVEMEEVSSDEDIEADPAEKEIEDEAGKTFPISMHESDSNDSRFQIQNIVSSSESINLVTTQFSAVTIPSDENSLIEVDFKRKSPLTDSNDQAQPGDADDVCSSHMRTTTPPLSFNDEKSSRAAPSSLSDNEDRTSQRSNGGISSHTSLPQEREKIVEDDVKDSTAEDGEMSSAKEPVDIMGEMELEPVSDEDSPLDNLSVSESSDGEKEEGEEKDSDKEDDKSSHKSSQVIQVETPSKTSDVVSKDDEASDEGEIKSDSEDSAKAVVEETERTANRKPIELVDFGEAEKRARGSRSFYPEAQTDRARTSRVITVSSLPPAASYRAGYTSWPQTDPNIHSQYPAGVRYSLSHEAVTSSRMRSPMAAVYDGGESETSSHSRSSVRLRDDIPPPYPIDGVKRKHRSPASDQGSSSLYKTLSPPSPVSSAASSRSRSSSSARSPSRSGSESSSSSSFSSSRSSQKKKRLKKKKSSKRRSADTEKVASLKSQTSTSKLPTSERMVSPMKFSEIPSIPVISQSRERLLSSGHESISSDELPYFPDEEPPKPSPKATISKSPSKDSPSTSSISSKSAHSIRKKKRESISSSELIYSPSRLKSPPHSSATSKEDDDDNISIERPQLSPGRSSISSDELPDYPVEDPDPTFMQQFSPHQPPLPSDLPPLPEDTDGFQPPLPQDSPPTLFDIQPPPPPPPIDEDDSKMQPFDSEEVEEGEIYDSEKPFLVPPEFEEGEIEDIVESNQAAVIQRSFADPRLNFRPPLKKWNLLPNSEVLSPFSSHVGLQHNLKRLLPSCTEAALHAADTHSQTLSPSDRISSASHPSSQHAPTVQAFSHGTDQEQNPNVSKDACHTTVLDCPKLQIGEKTKAVINTNQFGTTISSAQDLCRNTLEVNSASCAEALGRKAFKTKVGSLKIVETVISESDVSVAALHHKLERSKDVELIVSEDVFVPVTDLHHKVGESKDVAEDVFVPVTDLHHKVGESKDVAKDVFVPVTDLHHKVGESKDVELIVSEDVFVPVTDLHHKEGESKDVAKDVFVPVTDLHHKVEESKDVERIVSEDVFVPVTDLHHKVGESTDVESIISESVIVPVIHLHHIKGVETIISENAIVPMTDLHHRIEESKHKENSDFIVTNTDLTPGKAEITETTLPLSDLERKIENNKNQKALHSGSEVTNSGTEYSVLQTSEDLTNNMSESLSLKIISEIENGKSLAVPDLQCEDRNGPQLRSDRSIRSSETVVVISNLAINMDFEKDVSKLCSETKLESTTSAVFFDQTLESTDAKAVHIASDAIQEKSSSAKNSDTTNIKEITDALLQSCSDTTNVDDIKHSILPSNSDLIIEDRNVTVLQSISGRKIEDTKHEISQSWPAATSRHNESHTLQETAAINILKNETVVPRSSSQAGVEELHVLTSLPESEVKNKDIENEVSLSDLELRNEDFNKPVSQLDRDSSVLAQSSLCVEIVNSKSAILLQSDSSITLVNNQRVSDSACVSVECPVNSVKTVNKAEVESTEKTVDMSKQASLITVGESAHGTEAKSHAINEGKSEIPSVPSLLLCEEVASRSEDHKEGNVSVSSESSLLREEVACTLKEDLTSSLSLESTIVPEKSIPSQTVSSLQRGLSEECSLDSSTMMRPEGESPLLAQPLTINTEAESLHLSTQQSVESHTVELTSSEIRECDQMCSSKETSAISVTSNSKLASECSVVSTTIDSHKVRDYKVIDSSLRSESTVQSTSSEFVSDQTLKNTEVKPAHFTFEVIQENSSELTSLLLEKNLVKEQQSNSQSTAQSLSSELISDQTLKNTEEKLVHITCDAIQEKSSSVTTSLSAKNAMEPQGSDTESRQSLILSEEPVSLSEISQANNIAPTDQDNSTASSSPLKTDMLGSSQSNLATVTSLEPKLEHSKESVYSPQAAALPSPGQRSVSSEETYETSAATSITRSKRRMPEDSGNSSDTSAASNESLPKRRRRAENDKLVLTPASAPTSRPGTRLQHQQQQELAKPQTRGRSNSLPSNRAAKRKQDNDESPPTRKHKR